MATMTFLSELQSFLNENQVIYTVRRFLYTPPDGSVYIPGVGGCRRELLKVGVKLNDLESYYTNSGFQTKEDWWKKIQSLNNYRNATLYLYKVVKVR